MAKTNREIDKRRSEIDPDVLNTLFVILCKTLCKSHYFIEDYAETFLSNEEADIIATRNGNRRRNFGNVKLLTFITLQVVIRVIVNYPRNEFRPWERNYEIYRQCTKQWDINDQMCRS